MAQLFDDVWKALVPVLEPLVNACAAAEEVRLSSQRSSPLTISPIATRQLSPVGFSGSPALQSMNGQPGGGHTATESGYGQQAMPASGNYYGMVLQPRAVGLRRGPQQAPRTMRRSTSGLLSGAAPGAGGLAADDGVGPPLPPPNANGRALNLDSALTIRPYTQGNGVRRRTRAVLSPIPYVARGREVASDQLVWHRPKRNSISRQRTIFSRQRAHRNK